MTNPVNVNDEFENVFDPIVLTLAVPITLKRSAPFAWIELPAGTEVHAAEEVVLRGCAAFYVWRVEDGVNPHGLMEWVTRDMVEPV